MSGMIFSILNCGRRPRAYFLSLASVRRLMAAVLVVGATRRLLAIRSADALVRSASAAPVDYLGEAVLCAALIGGNESRTQKLFVFDSMSVSE